MLLQLLLFMQVVSSLEICNSIWTRRYDRDIYGRTYIKPDGLGQAQLFFHDSVRSRIYFGTEGGKDYRPETYDLADPYVSHKYFATEGYNKTTRIFDGTISWVGSETKYGG